jgi:hypothetical protein
VAAGDDHEVRSLRSQALAALAGFAVAMAAGADREAHSLRSQRWLAGFATPAACADDWHT